MQLIKATNIYVWFKNMRLSNLLLIIIFALLIKLPSFLVSHIENDEVVYIELTKNFKFTLDSYTLLNSEIIKILPEYIYNHAIFHHPPVFIILLKLVYLTLGLNYLVIVSVIAGLLNLYFIWKICFVLFTNKRKAKRIATFTCIVIALDPLSNFVNSKIWIDSLLGVLMLASFYYSLNKNSSIKLSLLLTLGLLTKIISIVIFPILLFIKIQKSKYNLLKLWPFLPPTITFFIWIYIYHSKTDLYFLDVRPTKEFINNFPYVEKTAHRPFFFYLVQLLFLNPIIIFAYIYILKKLKSYKKTSKNILYLIIFVFIYFMAMTLFGINDGVFQMRYIYPVSSILILLACIYLYKKPVLLDLVKYLFLPYLLVTTLINLLTLNADPITLFWFIQW